MELFNLRSINYKEYNDYTLFLIYNIGNEEIKNKVVEELWKKYQKQIYGYVYKVTYNFLKNRNVVENQVPEIFHEIFIFFKDNAEFIKINKIQTNFNYLHFIVKYLAVPIKHLCKKISKDYYYQDNNIDNVKDGIIYNFCKSNSNISTSSIANSDSASAIYNYYKIFKQNECNKKEQMVLDVLEKSTAGKLAKQKELSKKIGFNSDSAFIYHKNKLKRKYIDYMNSQGYSISY